jgi:hypothetical protein
VRVDGDLNGHVAPGDSRFFCLDGAARSGVSERRAK